MPDLPNSPLDDELKDSELGDNSLEEAALSHEVEDSHFSDKSLKNKVVKGGLYLAVRQLVSVGLSLLSILVIARVLGTTNYGILVNALGIYYFIIWTGKLGLHVYLIQQKNLPEDAPEQVLTFFNLLSLGFAIALFFLAPVIGAWTGEPAIGELVRWLPLPIALEQASSVSIAMLERKLAFAEVGLIEI